MLRSLEYYKPFKAYAKLNGSYEALEGGATSEALSDFTSGVSESFNLGDYGTLGSKIPKDLFRTLSTSFQKGAVGGASIEMGGATFGDAVGNGLLAGHSYTLRRATKVISVAAVLIKLFNYPSFSCQMEQN